ncbi:MAG: ATP-binding protein, partial [Actinomycetota bacterium]|nr:ATP-binding protein [Actinomycetota bacterium]
MNGGRPPYPLSAIVGQDDLLEALLICAVNPAVGGVLVRGERGTAKSTAVRALAPMLGGGDRPHSALVELPLGATLDRVVGTLDVQAALRGEHRVESGLLGRAHGGVLYVDEVNLLPDHLVDALLDAAASGEVTIERDGISVVQPARFLLVGTMNPEEGELRPQLLDRFGLGVEVRGPRDAPTRVEIVRRRLQFDADPVRFAREWEAAEQALAARIAVARGRFARVRLGERELLRIASVCSTLDLDGIRGDLVCAHAARALAALEGSDVTPAHVERAAHLALRHRLRRDPLAPPPEGGREPTIDDALTQAGGDRPGSGQSEAGPATAADNAAGQTSVDRAAVADADPDSSAPDTASEEGDAAGTDSRPAPSATPSSPRAWSPSPDLVAPPVPDRAPAPRLPSVPSALPARLPESALRLERG